MQARRNRPADDVAEGTVAEIVPARAVLTELARGFLLVHEADPERAKRFAQTFLREQAGPPAPERAPPAGRFAITRRGAANPPRDGPPSSSPGQR
jgi:hypothetical protein